MERQPPPDPVALLASAEAFAAPDFAFGEWQGGTVRDGVRTFAWFALSPAAQAFVRAAYAGHWVRPDIDWSRFAGSATYRRLRGDPAAIAGASATQLAELLTTLVRGDRFNEGLLAAAHGDGTIDAILRRMTVLAAAQPSRRSVSGSRSPS